MEMNLLHQEINPELRFQPDFLDQKQLAKMGLLDLLNYNVSYIDIKIFRIEFLL